MSQAELPDKGQTIWRTAPCPQCGGPVAWTIVSKATEKISCTHTPGEKRGKKPECGFTMQRMSWDYLLEKPHKREELLERFGKEPKDEGRDTSKADRILGI